MKRLVVYASGSGSGFENLVNASRKGALNAKIVAVVSNTPEKGVRERAERLKIPVYVFRPTVPDEYKRITDIFKPDFNALSGYLLKTKDLDPKTTFNIHPGLLPRYGGKGMYGHHVHSKVLEDFAQGKIQRTGLSMHFIPEDGEYDTGPVFFMYDDINIYLSDTEKSLGKRVNVAEHIFQPLVTNMVINGEIHWDGKNYDSLVVPKEKIKKIKMLSVAE